jgi:small conductance mechanosensitive channel
MTNQQPASVFFQMNETVMGRIYAHFAGHDTSTETRLLLIIGLAVFAHLAVKIIRHISEWIIFKGEAQKNALNFMTQQPKFITVTRLIVSAVTFVIYFFALGLILQEFGVDLTTYLASASVIGLAISFGLQGLVQDIVSGLTLIFWDVMDVGDLVEISGSTTNVAGRVEEIGLRYTKLINFNKQEVYVPNRVIANVSRFPRGGLDAYGDVQIPAGADEKNAVEIITRVAQGMRGQFGAIILSEPVIGELKTAPGGNWKFIRIDFKIWPKQEGLIETIFRQQMFSAMKTFDPNYADWQVCVTYRALSALEI